jgi:hypothetical protein
VRLGKMIDELAPADPQIDAEHGSTDDD